MPRITLHLDIYIKNYQEIACEKSFVFRVLNAIPFVEMSADSRVDSGVVKQIKSHLGEAVAEKIQEELSKKDIKSSVSYGYTECTSKCAENDITWKVI